MRLRRVISQLAEFCAVLLLLTLLATCGGGGESISPPNIVSQPQNALITEGGSATFSVTATGDGALSFQWQRNGIDVPGATAATYTAGPETFSDSGVQIRVRVTNEGGASLSDPATLTITAQCAGAAPNTGWCRVGAAPPGNIYEIGPVDSNFAWAIVEKTAPDGSYSLRLAKTGDAGYSWTYADLPQPIDSISAVSESVVWATGDRDTDAIGMVFRSADGGKTWVSQEVSNCAPSVVRPLKVHAVDANLAWAEDCDYIYKTTDGGASWAAFGYRWARALAPVGAQVVWALPHDLDDRGAAAAQNKVLLSVDGGASWTVNSLPTSLPTAIAAIDARTAWVVSWGGAIFKTVDGGVSWVQQRSGTDARFTHTRAIDANTVWAGADGGLIFRTIDGGATWEQRASAGPVRPVSRDAAWSISQFVVRTDDGGGTWVARSADSQFRLAVAGPATVWAAGVALFKSSNGGASWSLLRPFMLGPTDMAAVGSDTLWAIGGSSGSGGSQIALTRDAGRSWTRTTRRGVTLTNVAALDSQTAWVCCDGGLLTTADGGASWTTLTSFEEIHTEWIQTLVASSRTTLWYAADSHSDWNSGAVFRSVDGGVSWVEVLRVQGSPVNAPDPVMRYMLGVAAVDEQTVWSVGMQGAIYKTSDGGTTWVQQPSGTAVTLYAVAAIDSKTAWAVGENGTILSTVDGGNTWVAQPSGTTAQLRQIAVANRQIAWVSGWWPDYPLLKTTTGGN